MAVSSWAAELSVIEGTENLADNQIGHIRTIRPVISHSQGQ